MRLPDKQRYIEDMKQTPVKYPLSLPPDLAERAAEAANRLGEALSVWIRTAMREKLERDKENSA